MRQNLCKSVSVALSLLMVCALFCFGASAADATPVSTAEQFAAMAADGNYVLTADITINTTLVFKATVDGEEKEVPFTGTFDGAGHTVTVTVPMFSQMDGTVKNLTVVGDITENVTGDDSKKENLYLGAVARETTYKANKDTKPANFINITNKVNVTGSLEPFSNAKKLEDAVCVGGILGRTGGLAIFTGCVNYGTITGTEATGGILGEGQEPGVTFDGCTNHGKIESKGTVSGCAAGGICGYSGSGAININNCVNNGEITSAYCAGGMAGDARKGSKITNCQNYGKVTGKNDENKGDAAGMVGVSGDKDTTETSIVANCFNAGEIYGQNRTGGLVGYVYGTSKGSHLEMTNSVNIGKLSIGAFGSQFIAYTNSAATVVKNCVGAGEMVTVAIEGKVNRLVIFGCSSVDIEKCTVENVYLADGGKTEWLSWANYAEKDGNKDINAKNRITLATVLGKDLAGTTYKYPTYTDNTYATVANENNEMTFTNTAETPVNVKAVTRANAADKSLVDAANAAAGTTYVYLDGGKLTTVKPTGGTSQSGTSGNVRPAPTGDYSVVVVAAIAVVSVIGVAYVSKKKHIAD